MYKKTKNILCNIPLYTAILFGQEPAQESMLIRVHTPSLQQFAAQTVGRHLYKNRGPENYQQKAQNNLHNNLYTYTEQVRRYNSPQDCIEQDDTDALCHALHHTEAGYPYQHAPQELLQYAAKNNKPLCLEMLLANTLSLQEIAQFIDSDSLISAAKNGYAEIARILLDHGANPNNTDANGNTALHHSLQEKQFGAARTILRCNPSALQQAIHQSNNCYARTPLCWALKNRAPQDIIEALLEKDLSYASIGMADDDGYTPLHYAAADYNATLIAKLIQHGADIKAKTKILQATPLFMATRYGNCETTKALLDIQKEQELNLAFIGEFICEAFQQACMSLHNPYLSKHSSYKHLNYKTLKENWRKIAILFIKNSPKELLRETAIAQKILEHALFSDEPAIIYALHEHGVNLSQIVAEKNVTALHVALQFDKNDAAKALIEKGAVLNTSTANGKTPLHHAVGRQKYALAKQMLQATIPADSNKQDIDGNTPLHVAAQNRDIATFALLLEAGADPEIQNNQGKTAKTINRKREIQELFESTILKHYKKK